LTPSEPSSLSDQLPTGELNSSLDSPFLYLKHTRESPYWQAEKSTKSTKRHDAKHRFLHI
jgi:hypothetical protein